MPAKRYKKKPVTIEALQSDGSLLSAETILFWMDAYGQAGRIEVTGDDDFSIVIPTLEGDMTASPGDFIIKGVRGEFYPCKPDIFAETYEKEIIQKCPKCHQEVNICCSNVDCVCRKETDPKTILKLQWILFGVEISEKLGEFLWDLGWKINPIRNWNDYKLIEMLKCPYCGYKNHYGWWEDNYGN